MIPSAIAKLSVANVISDDAERDVDLFLTRFRQQFHVSGSVTRVFLAAQFFDLIKDWAKNIGFVIGNGAGKISQIFRALNDRSHALETHAGIDVPLRKGENVPSALALN